MAEAAVWAARAHGNPLSIVYAVLGRGRALAETEPTHALISYRQGLRYAREQRLLYFEAAIARDAAGLEAVHGELEEALTLFGRGHRIAPTRR